MNRKKNTFFKTLFVIVVALFLVVPQLSYAATYKPNNVITDEEFNNYNSMSRGYIHEFLVKKGSGLADLMIPTEKGNKSAADLFYETAQAYKVNPKLLIVTAQKEQSAITDDTLSDRQKEDLMGYGVYKGSTNECTGVDKQIDCAAWQFRRYVDRYDKYSFQKGKTKTSQDGVDVTPENHATAALYNYTPYAGGKDGYNVNDTGEGGNFLFWKVWRLWFAQYRPSGTLIREIDTPGIFLLKDKKRYPIWNMNVFNAHHFSKDEVVDISTEEMEGYSTIAPVRYPDGALIRSPKGTVYIIDHDERRGFATREVFEELGYQNNILYDATWEIVNVYPEGKSISKDSKEYANGTLLQPVGSKSVFQLWDGKLRPILDVSLFDRNFYWKNVIQVAPEVINSFPSGNAVAFRDGSLIRSSKGDIYVIENGERKHIARPSVFHGFGFKMSNVITVPDSVLNAHPEGEKLETY
ncbi:hypothetical protein KKH43_02315 [Patescibacteria group bacterium]|nr:hypothetical protein [Patescibacteria group bacterium]